MIGDIILVSEQDYNRAKEVFSSIKDNRIILIGGTSGSKKSELAYCLQKIAFENKQSSLVISLDDYYNTMPSIRHYNRKKQGLETVGLSEIDWDYLQRIYEDFQQEKNIHFKRVHRFLDAMEHNVIDSDDIDLVIFEGLYANYLRKFYSDNFSIYLEGSPAQTLEFRKKRGKEDESDSFRSKIVQKEYNVVCQLKRYSDIILPFEEE